MRPRYLEIEGLQSFKQLQKVDFDELGETGLFGIFGPTGSGKSTVLDAITLALYGKVQRAKGGTQGIINTDSNRAKVVFKFDLLKGNNRKTYRVERIYGKKKGQEIYCESKLARLVEECGDCEIPAADKLSDVNEKIEELLGLNHDDFTRAVVLPQNKFQEFLLMEKPKKREMLERIFYLEEYGRELNNKIAVCISSVSLELSNLNGVLSALGDASFEALSLAEKEYNEAEKNKKEIIDELTIIEKQYEEAKELRKIIEDLEFLMNKETVHLSNLEGIKAKKNLLDKAVKAQGLIDFINIFRNAEMEFKKAKNELDAISEYLPRTQKELEEASILLKKQQDLVETGKPKFLESKNALENALEIMTEIEQLKKRFNETNLKFEEAKGSFELKEKELYELKDKMEAMKEKSDDYQLKKENLKTNPNYKAELQDALNLENEIITTKKFIDGLIKKEKDQTSKIETLRHNFLEMQNNVNLTESSLGLLQQKLDEHEKAKPAERDEIASQLERYLKLKSSFEILKAKNDDINSLGKKLSDMVNLLSHYESEYEIAKLNKDTLKSEMEQKNEELKDIRSKVEENMVYFLSKNLKDGEPCPVCGSIHHPAPAFKSGKYENTCDETNNEMLLQNMEDLLQKKEGELSHLTAIYMEAEKKCGEINATVNNIKTQTEQIKQDVILKQDKLKDFLEENLPFDFKFLSIDEINKKMQEMKMDIENMKKERDIWEKINDSLSNDLKTKKDLLNNYVITKNSIQSEINANMEMREQIKKEKEEAIADFNEKAKPYNEFLKGHNVNSASLEYERISKNEKEIDKIEKEIKKLEEMQRSAREENDKLQKEKGDIDNRLASIKTNLSNLEETINDKQNKLWKFIEEGRMKIYTIYEQEGKVAIEQENIDNLPLPNVKSTDREIGDFIKIMESMMKDMEDKEKKHLRLVNKLKEDYNRCVMEKNTLENQVKIFGHNFENETLRIENALKQNGFADILEAEDAMLSDDDLNAIRNEIEEYEKIRRNIEAQKNMLINKLGGRSITEEEWIGIETLHNEMQEKKERAVSYCEVAKSNLNKIREKNKVWVDISNKSKELTKKAEILDQIKALFRGNSFIDFVAEERLRYIAREASETLGTLTKYRYVLELEPDIGFVVRDNANGGVSRMVNSLSGGETFIVSLSLALALSKQIQLKGQSPLEFFFLDEGFGTLDRELLDTVIDTLERLSTKERVIGVISHIPEMRQRILRRLIVEPPTADGLGSRLKIEKA